LGAGLRSRQKPIKEISKILDVKNSIPERSPADKNYKAVEYYEKFYLMDDGLVPGSNVRKRTRVPFKISKKFH
jgi:hypothetical protein